MALLRAHPLARFILPPASSLPHDLVHTHELLEHYADIGSFDRWTGLCGLLPEGLYRLLLPAPGCGFAGSDVRSTASEVAPLVRRLQFTILSSAADVLRNWITLQADLSTRPLGVPPWLAVLVPPQLDVMCM